MKRRLLNLLTVLSLLLCVTAVYLSTTTGRSDLVFSWRRVDSCPTTHERRTGSIVAGAGDLGLAIGRAWITPREAGPIYTGPGTATRTTAVQA